jgi:predicted ATPase
MTMFQMVASAVRSRSRRDGPLTRLIGRDEEIDMLVPRWDRAIAGEGQIVLLPGEPGLGKSHIMAALVERSHAEPHVRLRYSCSPQYHDGALFALIDQRGRASGFSREDMPLSIPEKLETLLARAAPPEENVAVLADLLSLLFWGATRCRTSVCSARRNGRWSR